MEATGAGRGSGRQPHLLCLPHRPVALFYPLADWPLYVKGGLGLATIELSVDPLVGFPIRANQQGIGATLGVGVDLIRLGPFTFSTSATWARQAYAHQSGDFLRVPTNSFAVIALGMRWR